MIIGALSPDSHTRLVIFALCCSYYTTVLAIYSFHEHDKCRTLTTKTLRKMAANHTQLLYLPDHFGRYIGRKVSDLHCEQTILHDNLLFRQPIPRGWCIPL